VRTPPESGDHAANRLVEYDADRRLKYAAPELEIHEEGDFRPLRMGMKFPLVIQVPERTSPVTHLDPQGPLERHIAGEVLAKWAKANGEIGNELSLGAAPYARRDTPGKELRILIDIGDQVEQLVRSVRDDLALRVRGHQAEAACAASRAARSAAKSASAW
jgi:hypothetical protein